MEAARALKIEPTPVVETAPAWSLPDRGTVGMLSFIVAEAAIFTIFVVAYLFYLGKSLPGRRRARCWRCRSSTRSACSPAA
jgi:heme/copper-type cytochrome/quinol oxidase subunit 3